VEVLNVFWEKKQAAHLTAAEIYSIDMEIPRPVAEVGSADMVRRTPPRAARRHA